MDEEHLAGLMATYVDVVAQIKAQKELKDELRTEILTLIKIAEIDSYQSEENMLQFITSKRRSFNKEEAITFIQEKGGDANAFFTESDYETLKIKAIGGSDSFKKEE